MERGSLITAGWVAHLIRDYSVREMSLYVVDALDIDIPDLAERPGFGLETGRITARRRTRGTHKRRERGSSRGLLRGAGRWLEAPEA